MEWRVELELDNNADRPDTNLSSMLEIKGDAAAILTHYVSPFSSPRVGRFEPCLESNNSISIFTQALSIGVTVISIDQSEVSIQVT